MVVGLVIYALHGVHAAEEQELAQALVPQPTSSAAGEAPVSSVLELPPRLASLEHEGLQGGKGYRTLGSAAPPQDGSPRARHKGGADKASLLPPGHLGSSAHDPDED